jgi:CheY-like chemotaxis protein
MASNRVLVVEDEPSVRGLQAILEGESIEVVPAADGEEGLRLAERGAAAQGDGGSRWRALARRDKGATHEQA